MESRSGFSERAGLSVDLAASSVTLRVDPATYSLDAIYGAAYIFIDRCFVVLDKPDAKLIA